MVRLYSLDGAWCAAVQGTYDTTEIALRDALHMWFKALPKCTIFSVTQENGREEAVILRDGSNPDYAHVLYKDGSLRTYKVTCELDDDGFAKKTVVLHAPFGLSRCSKESLATEGRVNL